ncbi:MAG: PorT family protein [Bacteroidales bacterium]|nr:PorT family protein [Bacteroidales bacterium]
MKKNYLKIILAVLLCWTTVEANAQWSIGAKFGWTRTTADLSFTGRIDETFSPFDGFDASFPVRYEFNDWLAIRADLSFMKRDYQMDRNLHYLDPVFTRYYNNYLMLPVMTDFSFGGEKLRGHLLCGGFTGYWVEANVYGKTYWMTDYYIYFEEFNEKREFNAEDQRFTAGLIGGIGLSYDVVSNGGFDFDALYYYDLVSYHKGYAHLSDPRYLNTLSVTFGVYYKF